METMSSTTSPTATTATTTTDQVRSSPPPPTLPGTLSPTSPFVLQEMKHMTSNPDLLTPLPGKDGKRPAKLATNGHGSPSRLGTRSPNDIPSSPSSIHSSSSAIFERDIEAPPNSLFASSAPCGDNAHHPSPATNHLNLHHNTAAVMIESSIPAVLTSAATALADDATTSNNISVIAPAVSTPQTTHAGLATTRPISIPVSSANSALGSRSPSPTRRNFSTGSSVFGGAISPERSASFGAVSLGNTGPLPPGGYPGSPSLGSRSPAVSAMTSSPSHSPPSLSPMTATIQLPAPALLPAGSSDMYPPTPGVNQNKRLSFISYNDLLSSAPVSSVPLGSLVSPTSDDPPPHISTVLGNTTGSGMPTSPESVAGDIPEFVGSGGEWEREGFGKGLEARLEDVLKQGTTPTVQMTA